MQLNQMISLVYSNRRLNHYVCSGRNRKRSTGLCFVFASFLFCLIFFFFFLWNVIHLRVFHSNALLHALVHTPCVALRPGAAATCCIAWCSLKQRAWKLYRQDNSAKPQPPTWKTNPTKIILLVPDSYTAIVTSWRVHVIEIMIRW